MRKRPSSQQTARQRAEVIMKVRCGLMSASQAANILKISRKTYYKWEQQRLEKQLEQAHRENALLTHKIAIQDVLTDMKLKPGCDRVKKK
jgi:predicted transcriptional regulator